MASVLLALGQRAGATVGGAEFWGATLSALIEETAHAIAGHLGIP